MAREEETKSGAWDWIFCGLPATCRAPGLVSAGEWHTERWPHRAGGAGTVTAKMAEPFAHQNKQNTTPSWANGTSQVQALRPRGQSSKAHT